MKEGEHVMFNQRYDADHAEPVSTSSVILELQAGERVQVENTDSGVIYGVSAGTSIYRLWFSGFLLYGL